ncbi:transketolase [Clostridium sp. CTA-7]
MYNDLKEHSINIRKNIIEMIAESKSGHPGGSLSAVEILTYLYFKEMNIDKNNLDSKERDYFVLSKGHAAPALYSTLIEKGLIDKNEVKNLRKIGSILQGHPDSKKIKAVDISTGSLGQGISNAVGLAIASKINEDRNRVYAILGDGELQEGIVWEAFMSAAHYKLDNLVAFIDNNKLQIDGKNDDVMKVQPLDEKFKGFGWNVEIVDGHKFDEIENALEKARESKGKPTVIIANTIKGKGVSFMENKVEWHGTAPNSDQKEKALYEIENEIREE